MTQPDATRLLFPALYAGAILVLVDQAAELATSLHPFTWSSSQWRYGAFGLTIGRATTGVIFDAMVLIAAVGSGHRRFLRVWAVVHLVFGLLLLAGLAAFLLDAVELRRAVRPEMAGPMLLASSRAAFVAGLGTLYCVGVAVGILRAVRILAARRGEVAKVVVQG
ncbi:MAG: hypothetical protein FJ206_16415 [Gemmatimonadetes bacterium]|nr:hypothetical protein [Gemmatimonadota bacterium]